MTISIKILNGRYAGGTLEIPVDKHPAMILTNYLRNDVRRKIDYEEATIEEYREWERAYMIYRMGESLLHGRCVRLQSREWKRGWFTNVPNMVSDILQSIDNTEMYPYLDVDDASGVTIGLSETFDDWMNREA